MTDFNPEAFNVVAQRDCPVPEGMRVCDSPDHVAVLDVAQVLHIIPGVVDVSRRQVAGDFRRLIFGLDAARPKGAPAPGRLEPGEGRARSEQHAGPPDPLPHHDARDKKHKPDDRANDPAAALDVGLDKTATPQS